MESSTSEQRLPIDPPIDGDKEDNIAPKPNIVPIIDIDIFTQSLVDIEHFSALVWAPRRGGKTTLITAIIKKIKRHFKKIVIFKSTSDGEYVFKSKKIAVCELDNNKLMDLVELQKKLKLAKKKYPILIIFDDVLDKVDKHTRRLLDAVAFNGRHLMLSVLFSTQTLTRVVTPAFRDNMDVTILGKPRGANGGFIYDNYFKFEHGLEYKRLCDSLAPYDKIFINEQGPTRIQVLR